MKRTMKILGTAVVAAALGLSSAVNAATVHRHLRHAVADGHQIVVHARESYLTAGTGAAPGDYNGYALQTIGPTPFMANVDHTFVGVRGLERLPNNFTVPNCCVP